MPTYHFDVGDSNVGPIGFCASVRAPSREVALELLKEQMSVEVDALNNLLDEDPRGETEYVRVYLNPDALNVDDVDSEEPADKECKRCGEPNDDGEGEQGFCGNCADRALICKECDETVQPEALRAHLREHNVNPDEMDDDAVRHQYETHE